MNKRILSLLAASVVAAAGCSSDSNYNPPAVTPPVQNPDVANVQLLHASPDAPAVNVIGLTGSPVTGIDYKQGSGGTVSAGTYDGVQIDGILPDGSTTPVFGPIDGLTLEADTLYTVLALGDDLNIEPLILSQPATPVPAGNTRLQVVHGAPNAPEVSVFLTAPDADLTASMPVITFGFGESMPDPVDVTAGGPYQVRVTLPFGMGETPVVVFDSGEITLPDGANLVITAVENTFSADALEADESPISLVALNGIGGTIEFQDANTAAEVRVVHASADTPAVDIIVNDDLESPFISNLSFPEFAPAPTGFVEVPAGSYDVSVVDSDTQAAEPIDIDGLPLAAGVTYDIVAINEFAAVEAFVATDDYRRLETAAKVRIIHASTVADAVSPTGVDIYVTAPDTVVDETVMPTIDNFEYGVNTGFIQLEAGDYKITVTADGSKEPAIPPATVTLSNNGIYTAIARDPRPDVMNDGLGLILLDDFNAGM